MNEGQRNNHMKIAVRFKARSRLHIDIHFMGSAKKMLKAKISKSGTSILKAANSNKGIHCYPNPNPMFAISNYKKNYRSRHKIDSKWFLSQTVLSLQQVHTLKGFLPHRDHEFAVWSQTSLDECILYSKLHDCFSFSFLVWLFLRNGVICFAPFVQASRPSSLIALLTSFLSWRFLSSLVWSAPRGRPVGFCWKQAEFVFYIILYLILINSN